ncbi:MAG: sugar nucleotide-binding protein [Candidatus Liptonbacteria bacterium]|nr:sugar nucleotide-binding protein [Candidatus Liptonbacteria bacterium]
MKKSVAILGATGMLGSALYMELKNKYSLILGVRDVSKIELLEKAYGGTKEHVAAKFDATPLFEDFLNKKGEEGIDRLLLPFAQVDYVVNAVGVTIPFSKENPALTLFVNGALPHMLAERLGPKLIHVTTDCVYNGMEGFPYDEHAPKSPVDLYGLSKSLGEPTRCLTLRTSIIGRELEGFTGLLEWFLAQKGRTIKGFANHFWNGLTTKEFAKVCDKVISAPEAFPETGLYHIFSTKVSKYEMLQAFKTKFKVDCELVPESEGKLNRTLSTIHDMNKKLGIPSFEEMVREL